MKWITILVLALAACKPPSDSPVANVSPPVSIDLMKINELPDFMFLERAGKPLAKKDMLGKVWIVAFVFTRCPTHCVWMTQEMQKLQKEFKDAADFRMVSTSVDPTWDTPEVLTRFAMDYNADTSRWFFLTGERDEIRKFAIDGCLLSWPSEDLRAHSLLFTLIDRQGVVRGQYHIKEEGRAAKLRKDIRTLLAEKKTP